MHPFGYDTYGPAETVVLTPSVIVDQSPTIRTQDRTISVTSVRDNGETPMYQSCAPLPKIPDFATVGLSLQGKRMPHSSIKPDKVFQAKLRGQYKSASARDRTEDLAVSAQS